MSRKLKVAIAGLGRQGTRHAAHFHALTPRAEVIAATSIDSAELEWAKQNLDGVRTYLDFDDMLEKETELEAVVIASATTVHAEQAIKAIKKGLHVLCEKPLSINVDIVSFYIEFLFFAKTNPDSHSLSQSLTPTTSPLNASPTRK